MRKPLLMDEASIRRRAWCAVARALDTGLLKIQPCAVCGRWNTHAHHEDYAKPLDVRWLCAAHHLARHREIRATKVSDCASTMSNAILVVRFPDGALRYGTYQGSSDTPYPTLYLTPSEWQQAKTASRQDPIGEVYPVDIYSDYGNGWSWKGTAAKNTLVDDGYIFDQYLGMTMPERTGEGQPDWLPLI